MRPYKPSGTIPIPSLLALLMGVIFGGVILGGIFFGISQIIYLIVLFPILMGLAAGFIMAMVIDLGKVRNRLIAILFSLLLAVATYGTLRYAEYYFEFRGDIRSEWETILGTEISSEDADELTNLYLEDETGSTGFVGYLKLYAESGISFSRATRPGSEPATINGVLAWIYWAIEFGIIAWMAVAAALKQAGQPFSEEENMWFEKRHYIGTVQNAMWGEVKQLLEQGDFTSAAQKIVYDKSIAIPRTDVIILYANDHANDVALSFETVKQSGKNVDRKSVYYGLITRNDLNHLLPQEAETSEA